MGFFYIEYMETLTKLITPMIELIKYIVSKWNRKETLCIDFINIMYKSEYYTNTDNDMIHCIPHIYKYNSVDFSSYTLSYSTLDPSKYMNDKEYKLVNFLQERSLIHPTELIMKERSNKPSNNDIIQDVKTSYPLVYKKLEQLFNQEWCYKYDIQKCFGVKLTHKNPYII